jgi:hypothetical protein
MAPAAVHAQHAGWAGGVGEALGLPSPALSGGPGSSSGFAPSTEPSAALPAQPAGHPGAASRLTVSLPGPLDVARARSEALKLAMADGGAAGSAGGGGGVFVQRAALMGSGGLSASGMAPGAPMPPPAQQQPAFAIGPAPCAPVYGAAGAVVPPQPRLVGRGAIGEAPALVAVPGAAGHFPGAYGLQGGGTAAMAAPSPRSGLPPLGPFVSPHAHATPQGAHPQSQGHAQAQQAAMLQQLATAQRSSVLLGPGGMVVTRQVTTAVRATPMEPWAL